MFVSLSQCSFKRAHAASTDDASFWNCERLVKSRGCPAQPTEQERARSWPSSTSSFDVTVDCSLPGLIFLFLPDYVEADVYAFVANLNVWAGD